MQTYLFYDIETTGLNKSFDQVLQFAAIRTDMECQEISRHEFKIKLNPDVIPAPRAVMTHGIGVTAGGLVEFEAIQQIHALLNEPGTISLGYNTLGFDDEFLRFAFFRNLLPPYTHQFSNLCQRMDLYPITVMYQLYQHDSIKWPVIDDKLSLRLEHLNQANQLADGRAHDAMVDVEVTLALAKRFMQVRDVWDYISHYFSKNIDAQRFHQLPAQTIADQQHAFGLMILGKFGAKENYQAPVLYLGESAPYKNQLLWLRLDSENLLTVTAETIAEQTWVIRKKWGEPPFVLPPAERFLKHLSPRRLATALANKQWLEEHPELLQKIIAYHRHFTYPAVAATDADASLYVKGFWNAAETEFCRQFQLASPAEKVEMTTRLPDSILKTLALRIIGRNYPDHLSDTLKSTYDHYFSQLNNEEDQALVDFKGNKRLTAKLALLEIEAIRAADGASLEQSRLLDDLENYLKSKWE